MEAQTDSTGKSSPGQLAPKLERQVEEASPPPSSPDSSSSSSQSEGQGPLKAEPSAGSPHNLDEYFSPETEEVTMVPLPKDEEPSPRPMAEPQDEVPSPGPAQKPQVSLAVLHKEVLRMPLSLSGQLKPHRGSPNAPWTYFVPDQLTDQLGRSWSVTGVGGSRITLEVPDDLGPGAGHQVLKLGPPESCLDEYRWFETLARDFQYVPRPSIKGEIQPFFPFWLKPLWFKPLLAVPAWPGLRFCIPRGSDQDPKHLTTKGCWPSSFLWGSGSPDFGRRAVA